MNPPAAGSISRACPVCSALEHEPWLVKGALELVRCAACGMIYAMISSSEFADGSFYQSTGSSFYLSEDKLRGDYSPARYRREVKLLRKYVKAGSVLDVGCSTGGFLFHLSQTFPRKYQVFGTDVPSEALKFAEEHGVKILPGDFLKSPERLTYHAITFWAVLEHLANPRDFLVQAHKMLKPRGICIVLVPNIRSMAVKLLGARYRYILPQHLNYFSAATLQRLVREVGFEIVRKSTTHFNPAVIWKDWRSRGQFVTDTERAKLLTKTNALKERKVLAPLRLAYGGVEKVLGSAGLADNLVVVARKRPIE